MNGMYMGFPGMDNSNVSDITANSLDVTDNIEISRASSQLPIHAGEYDPFLDCVYFTFFSFVLDPGLCRLAKFAIKAHFSNRTTQI